MSKTQSSILYLNFALYAFLIIFKNNFLTWCLMTCPRHNFHITWVRVIWVLARYFLSHVSFDSNSSILQKLLIYNWVGDKKRLKAIKKVNNGEILHPNTSKITAVTTLTECHPGKCYMCIDRILYIFIWRPFSLCVSISISPYQNLLYGIEWTNQWNKHQSVIKNMKKKMSYELTHTFKENFFQIISLNAFRTVSCLVHMMP